MNENDNIFSNSLVGKKYRHFKGKEYVVLHIAQDSETLEEIVVYQALYGNNQVWVRSFSEFNNIVIDADYKLVSRFSSIK